MLWKIAGDPRAHGMLHWTDAGVASWYDFAAAIAENAIALGLIAADSRVEPVGTSEYPTPAPRPMYGVLDKRSTVAMVGVTPAHWRVELAALMRQLPGS
jgi:dTDP-4-dehydrorhamnose reductase